MHATPLDTGNQLQSKNGLYIVAQSFYDDANKHATVQVAKFISILPGTKSIVVVAPSQYGLMTIEQMSIPQVAQMKSPCTRNTRGLHECFIPGLWEQFLATTWITT